MTLVHLTLHGRSNRAVVLDAQTGRVVGQSREPNESAGRAFKYRGTWYALYRLDGDVVLQAGQRRWPVSDVTVRGSGRRLARRFEVVDQAGCSVLDLRYVGPLSSLVDPTYDDDDDILLDFFRWVYRAVTNGWLKPAPA